MLGVLLLLLFLVYPVSAVGVFRNTNGYWSLDYNNTGTTDTTFHFGKTGDIPVVGDWDGEGTMDTGVFRPIDRSLVPGYHQNRCSKQDLPVW